MVLPCFVYLGVLVAVKTSARVAGAVPTADDRAMVCEFVKTTRRPPMSTF
jgi:hypothetical protein